VDSFLATDHPTYEHDFLYQNRLMTASGSGIDG
jgi:hypothetical protein